MRIVIDAMGGDHAPEAQVQGMVTALRVNKKLRATIVGNKGAIEQALKPGDGDVLNRVALESADSVIPMELTDRELMKSIAADKKDGWKSSIGTGARILEAGEGDVLVSSGNTAATWMTSKKILGMIDGVKQGALVATLPTIKRRQFVAVGDVGLVTDRSAYEIAEAALLAGAYAKHAYGTKRDARIGLLSNGSEPGKGNKSVQEADELLQSLDLASYVRNVEPEQIFEGHVDGVGKDGFVGNTSLKWIEATAKLIKRIQEEEIMSDPAPLRLLNWLINRSKWRRMKKRLTAEENAAAPFVGLPKMVYKVHGSATMATFAAGILQAARLHERNIVEDIRSEVVPLAEKLQKRG